MTLEGLKIVTASEMALGEQRSLNKGSSSLTFMENAGRHIADSVQAFVEKRCLARVVTLLVGKGNNGGDAYNAGIQLLREGFNVRAIAFYPLDQSSSLCQQMQRRFLEEGGSFNDCEAPLEGILLDGLTGSGFRGSAEGVLASAINCANQSGLPILSIDIPSGLHADTGCVETVAIRATQTLCLGMAKTGYFLNQGWDHVGELLYLDFGLPAEDRESAQPAAYLLEEKQIRSCFPMLKRSRHKYEAGYLLAIAGSKGMGGSALLTSSAAMRAGAGIVRLFHQPGMEAELNADPYEVVREEWNGYAIERIVEEAKRAKALLIGPGIGRKQSLSQGLAKLLSTIDLPVVLDADALFFIAENPAWVLPKGSILTPHAGEMKRLLSQEVSLGSVELDCQAYANKKHVTLVLKGAVTWIFHPFEAPLVCTRGDPGMATAGSGDVLTGIIAGLLAQGLSAKTAAALGVYLHGLSGELAAKELTSYCMIASDLIAYLPAAFRSSLITYSGLSFA